MTHLYGSSGSIMVTAARGSCRWLRVFTRSVVVVKRKLPSSKRYHITVSCGLPLGLIVARCAYSGRSRKATAAGENSAAMLYPLCSVYGDAAPIVARTPAGLCGAKRPLRDLAGVRTLQPVQTRGFEPATKQCWLQRCAPLRAARVFCKREQVARAVQQRAAFRAGGVDLDHGDGGVGHLQALLA